MQVAACSRGQHELEAEPVCNPGHECGRRTESLQAGAEMTGEHAEPGIAAVQRHREAVAALEECV